MTDVYARRIDDLRQRMEKTGTDLVVLGPSSHMAWLSGVDPHGDERPVMLLVGARHAGFLMPALNAASARKHTDLPFECWADADGPDAALSRLIDACVPERAHLSVVLDETMRADFALRLLDAIPGAIRRFTDDSVGALRAMKDEAEEAALIASARVNDAAAMEAFDALAVGMTERDVQEIIRAAYERAGATPAFTIVAFGANGAFPHHHTGDTRLQPEMPVLIDTGCRIDGYPSDMTRCGWFGTPTDAYRKVFDVVEQAVQAALAAARIGKPAAEVDDAARSVIAAAGHGPDFLHRTGHGLGIDVHEPPYITASNKVELVAGNVFSIEPGIYMDGVFGVRLEDIVILKDSGPEILSGLSRDMIVTPVK